MTQKQSFLLHGSWHFLFLASLLLAGCADFNEDSLSNDPSSDGSATTDRCSRSCHGSGTSAAPPTDFSGNTETTARGVGAHASHLVESDIAEAVECNECHIVPDKITHVNGIATVTFGTIATTGDLAPSWDGTRCSNSYCHGGSLSGGTLTAPNWTTVDGTQAACGTCHGTPPADHAGAFTNCNDCHAQTVGASDVSAISDISKHLNGQTEIVFSDLAKTGGLNPTWNGSTCSNTYCHGATLADGITVTAAWSTIGQNTGACDTCHGTPPSNHNAGWTDCTICHRATVGTSDPLVIATPANHINGTVDFN